MAGFLRRIYIYVSINMADGQSFQTQHTKIVFLNIVAFTDVACSSINRFTHAKETLNMIKPCEGIMFPVMYDQSAEALLITLKS